MSAFIDLTEVLMLERARPRGDEREPHISDLYGCDRATWYRRSGERPLGFSKETLARFAIGHGYEEQVARSLKSLGFSVARDVVINYKGLTGHLDIVLDGRVIEIKTTGLRKPKKFASPHYVVQAISYAVALDTDEATILVYHKGSDLEVQYDVCADDFAWDGDGVPYEFTWRFLVQIRIERVLERTNPDAPIPEANPGVISPWGCGYCDWAQCYKNPKYEPDGEIPL